MQIESTDSGLGGPDTTPRRDRQTTRRGLLVLIALACIGLATPASAGPTRTHTITDVDGKTHEVSVGPMNAVIAVASWCSTCHTAIGFLADPRVQKQLTEEQIVFLVADEWDASEGWLRDDLRTAGVPEAELERRLAEVREAAGSAFYWDRDWIAGLPGEVIVVPWTYLRAQKLKRWPSLLSRSGRRLNGDFWKWLLKDQDRVYRLYPVIEEMESEAAD